jgi:5-methylcytosine-specific restriction endonuclease McrA
MKRSEHKKAKDKLWSTFSQYIRIRDKGRCFTCGVRKDWKLMQAGHFVRAAQGGETWLDEVNVNAQCSGCNMFKQGEIAIYAARLEEKYGHGIIQELEKKKNTMKQWRIPEMQRMTQFYKEKIEQLLLQE